MIIGPMYRGLTKRAVVFAMIASLCVSPAYVQAQEPSPQAPAAQTLPSRPAPMREVKLAGDYSVAKPWFPNIARPYTSSSIAGLQLDNPLRIGELIQGGKLMLSLEDAISLALENNLAIAVERYVPWLDQVNLLRAKSGANGLVPFDPQLSGGLNLQTANTPINNPLFSGIVPTGNTTPTATTPDAFEQHIANVNFQYAQYFHNGSEFQASIANSRTSVNFSSFNLYNPFLQSTLTLQFTQPLLKGAGTIANTRLILEAKNLQKAGLSQLSQQVMATVAQVSTDYWELVYARENVKVEEASVQVSQTLFDDNKTRASIGTLSRLDVLTAQSQLAADKQALVQAQSVELQDQTTLLNDVTKNPSDTTLAGIEIIPTTPISAPSEVEKMRLEDAVKEAWEKRPELQQMSLNLKNAGIEVKATKNELLPAVNLFGEYIATGLGGIQTVTTTGAQPAVVVFPGGLGQTLSRMFNGSYPSLELGLNFSLPVRNRAAQADNAQALLNLRQQETQYRQEQNTIFVSVRNALVALQKDRESLEAAAEARSLAVQTFEAEQEKYKLGASTSYDVVLRSRDVTTAQGTELRVSVNLIEDELKFNQALGRTLEANHISIADALKGNSPGSSASSIAVEARK